MATPNAGILDTVLNTFRSQIDSGFAALQGPVSITLGTLIVISVTLMALFWALDETGSVWSPLIRKGMICGWWAYMILNWQSTALAVYTAFGNLGAQVGNAGGLSGFLNSPSKIVALGLGDAKVLMDLSAYYLGVKNQWGTPPVMQPVGLDIGAALMAIVASLVNAIEALFAAILIMIAFFWLALEIVVTTIEFHIVILMGFCILPFGVFERTASYAERVLSYVISAGMKVMALGIVIGLSQNFLVTYQVNYTPGSLPGLDEMAGLALAILVLLMLAISAPKYAQAIISGSASTGMGQFAGAAGLAVGAGMAAAGGLKAIGGAIQGAPGAAVGAASFAKSVANGTMLDGLPGSTTSKSGPGGSGGSPGGVAGSGGSAASADTAGLAATVAPPTSGSPGAGSAATASSSAGSTEGLAQTITAPSQGSTPSSPPSRPQAKPPAATVTQFASSVQRAAESSEGSAEPPSTSGSNS
jgi:type IV secretion system protein TrbL